MTPKPAPRTVHHPHLATFDRVITLRRSRARRSRRNFQTHDHLAALTCSSIAAVPKFVLTLRRPHSFSPQQVPARAHLAMHTLRSLRWQQRPSRSPCDVRDHLHRATVVHRRTTPAFASTLRCPRRLAPPCSSRDRARLSTLTFAIFAAQPTQTSNALRRLTLVRAAGWPRIVFVLRRSRHARLHGACARARLSTFALASTLGSRRRPFLRTSLIASFARSRFVCSLRSEPSALTFSCSCPRSSCDAHGRTHSVGSQSTGSRDRVTFRRRKAPILFRFEDRRSMPHPSIALVLIFRRSRSRCRTGSFEQNTSCDVLHP